jgi:hypothetical protein
MARKPETEQEKKAIVRFRTEVCARAREVDENEEYHWFELGYGFFLGCGLDPASALEMALYVRYNAHYWTVVS